MATYFGFGPPFLSGSEGSLRVLPMQSDIRLIKNDLLQLLLTAPGERVMRPTFGSQMRPTLFEQIDTIQMDNLDASIRDTISTYDSRVNVTDVQISRDEDNNMIGVKVFGSVNLNENNIGAPQNLLIEFNIPSKKVI